MSSLPQHLNVNDVHGSVPQVSPKSAVDVHGSVPDVSQNPTADVHGYADSQNVNNIIPHIEELKGHLKTYVDKKFEKLIILIKANHSQLMQSISKENINFLADTSTFQSDKQTSQQIPVELDDMGGVAEDGGGFSGKNGEHHIVDDAGDVDVDGVGVSVNEGEQIVSDNPKSHQDLNEHIKDQAVDDNVQHNIPHVLPEKTTTDSSVHFSILIYDTQFHYTQIYSKNHYIILYKILQLQQQYRHQLKQQ
nr:uncharacterized protein LOC112940127 [Solanum lycopersicum]